MTIVDELYYPGNQLSRDLVYGMGIVGGGSDQLPRYEGHTRYDKLGTSQK